MWNVYCARTHYVLGAGQRATESTSVYAYLLHVLLSIMDMAGAYEMMCKQLFFHIRAEMGK